jgi:hypothetical protein
MTTNQWIVSAALTGLLLAGCNERPDTAGVDSNKVRVGYIGLTCEAPITTRTSWRSVDSM